MSQRKRVLLVDDRDLVRATLRSTLVGFDCVFTEAENGQRALELILSNTFDAVVLDLKLPDLSGFEVLRHARDRGAPVGQVIILTGLPDLASRVEAARLGVFRFLSKPMHAPTIRQALQDATGIAPAPETAASTMTLPSLAARTRADPRPRLLLIDRDEESLRDMLQVLVADFDVDLATNADSAYRRLARESYDLLVVDMDLGGVTSGLEMVTRIRKSAPNLRAIVVAAAADPDVTFDNAQRGALRYAAKGDWATLKALIVKLLSEPLVRVFLCYARANVAAVGRLYGRLTAHGLLPWMDVKSIGVGGDWAFEIGKAIAETDYFLFCMSNQTVHRAGPLLEVQQAIARQEAMPRGATFVIPVRLEACDIDESMRRFNCVDLFQRDGFAKLVRKLSVR